MKRFFENFGMFVRKALLSLFVITDDLPFSLNEFYRRTIASPYKVYIYLIVGLFWALCVLGIVKTLPNLSKSSTTYNVRAETDIVKIRTSQLGNKLVWWVDDAQVYLGCSDDPKETGPFSFSGRLVFENNVDIEVKAWKGLFANIAVQGVSRGQTILEAWRADDSMAFDAQDCADIKIEALEDRKQIGQTFVFPISGDISIGGEVSFRKNDGYLLRSGQVHILDKGVLVQHYYSVGPFELSTGDKFKIKDPSVDSAGFISLNESSMLVVYRGQGRSGVAQRYMSEDYEISNNIWTRLYHDQTLIYLWMCLLIFFAFIKVLIRFMLEE